MTWRERIISEIEKGGPDMSAVDVGEDGPPYVARAFELLCKAMVPTVKLERTKMFSPRQLGGIVGHQFAFAKPFQEGLNLSAFLGTAPADVRNLFEELAGVLREYFPLVRRAVRRCLAIACDAPQKESAEFFAGFAAALQKGSLTPTARLVGATDASEFYYLVICLGSRLEQQFKSMSQFHEFCVQLWGQRAGDRKTTEKRCSRIGLSFGGVGERGSK